MWPAGGARAGRGPSGAWRKILKNSRLTTTVWLRETRHVGGSDTVEEHAAPRTPRSRAQGATSPDVAAGRRTSPAIQRRDAIIPHHSPLFTALGGTADTPLPPPAEGGDDDEVAPGFPRRRPPGVPLPETVFHLETVAARLGMTRSAVYQAMRRLGVNYYITVSSCGSVEDPRRRRRRAMLDKSMVDVLMDDRLKRAVYVVGKIHGNGATP